MVIDRHNMGDVVPLALAASRAHRSAAAFAIGELSRLAPCRFRQITRRLGLELIAQCRPQLLGTDARCRLAGLLLPALAELGSLQFHQRPHLLSLASHYRNRCLVGVAALGFRIDIGDKVQPAFFRHRRGEKAAPSSSASQLLPSDRESCALPYLKPGDNDVALLGAANWSGRLRRVVCRCFDRLRHRDCITASVR